MNKRICMLVLGMHRSGTSALTRMLSFAGAALPENLMHPNAANEAGFWEPINLVNANDRFLADCGTRWDSIRPIQTLPENSANKKHKEEIADILEKEYGDAKLIVLKDPRICRFANFYLELLDEMGFRTFSFIPYRNPLDVAESLRKRDEMSSAWSALLWLRHVIDAELATRDRQRMFVSFANLLGDPVGILEKIRSIEPELFSDLPDEIRADIEAFVDPGLRHHLSTLNDVINNPITGGWVSQVYQLVRWAEKSGFDQTDLVQLDQIRNEFDAMVPLFEALHEDVRGPSDASDSVSQIAEDGAPAPALDRET